MPDSSLIIPPFLEGLVRFLMPYFLPTCPNPDVAREEILETLVSYGGRSRSEIINAARIIAYSYAALETLADARAPDLSPAMRLRHNSSANALNRACLQNERALEKRLAAALPDAGTAEAASPEAASPEAAPSYDLSDADFLAAIPRARVNIAAYGNPLATNRAPNPPARPDSPNTGHSPHWDQVVKDMYAELGISADDIKAIEKATQLAASSHPRGA